MPNALIGVSISKTGEKVMSTYEIKNFTDIQACNKYFSYSEHPSRVKSQTRPVLFLQTATILPQAVLLLFPSVGSSFVIWPQIFYTRFFICNTKEF
jgi:hypothetical protein